MDERRFLVADSALSGLRLVTRACNGDRRGFLARLFCAEELADAGWLGPVAQINHTFTAGRGTVRGMHFQYPPHAEMKLVTCISGEIWDVAVDLRVGSSTFLHWHAERLSATNYRALLIPQGFAHGYQALTDGAQLIYVHSCGYKPTSESGLNPLDATIAIDWPLPVKELSARDAGYPPIDANFVGIAP